MLFCRKNVKRITKRYITSKLFEKEFSEIIDNQPLTLNDWTNNIPCSNQSEVGNAYLYDIKKRIQQNEYHLSSMNAKRNTTLIKDRNQRYQIINSPIGTQYSFSKVVLIDEKMNLLRMVI